ncbi:MAG TPA: hypothetical protein P5532_23760, partial [Planctomycetota bacterium]|nr:hypothetical protein [Planctomycetota bacterium]
MRPFATTLALACASASVLADAIPPDKVPAFAIPRMSKPPTLDGKIDADEWREAVAVSGVVNQADNLLVPRPTLFFLAWDPGHLYLACRTWVMPGYKPRVGGREPGAANAGDDGLELHFKPMGKNVPTGRTDSSYKFFINCLGFPGETVRVAVGQMFRNWLPDFKVATRLTEPGSAPNGGRWWECEVAATPSDFELSGPHQAGDTWRLMLGFNHMPIWLQARIPTATSYFDPSGYCLGTLVENTAAVQLLMDTFPGPCDGTAAATFRAFNPTPNPAKLSILVHYVHQSDLLKREQALEVPPRASAEWKLNEKLPRAIGKDAASIEYRVADGGRELLRYFAFFKVGYDEALVKHTLPKDAFPFAATFNPIRSTLLVSGDAYYLDAPEAAKALRYRVVREGASQPLAEGTIEKPITHYFRDLIQLPSLREGKHTVEASLLLNDGKAAGPVATTFEKLDEAKAFPEWWQKGLGDAERVIPPFVPMTKERDKVTAWGRAYRLNALGLPASIESQGKELLAAPARIVVTVNGRDEAIAAMTTALDTGA